MNKICSFMALICRVKDSWWQKLYLGGALNQQEIQLAL